MEGYSVAGCTAEDGVEGNLRREVGEVEGTVRLRGAAVESCDCGSEYSLAVEELTDTALFYGSMYLQPDGKRFHTCISMQ